MITFDAHDGLVALLRERTPFTVHDGTVPALPSYPYVLVGYRVSYAAARSLVRNRHARRVSWLLTLAGLSDDAVRVLTETCMDLDGARIQDQRLELEPALRDVQTDDDAAPDAATVHFTKITASLTLPV